MELHSPLIYSTFVSFAFWSNRSGWTPIISLVLDWHWWTGQPKDI